MKFLKIVMLFITAIWGFVFVLVFPVGMLVFAESTQDLPIYIPVLWLLTAIFGFVTPCFLVRFKLYNIAAGLCTAGAVSLLMMHFNLSKYTTDGFEWFYMPLLVETATVVLLAILAHKRKKKLHDNAPAPSILKEKSNK